MPWSACVFVRSRHAIASLYPLIDGIWLSVSPHPAPPETLVLQLLCRRMCGARVRMTGVIGMGIVFNPTDIHLSYLPLAHVFEMLVETVLWYGGARVGFSQGNPAKILDDLKVLRPTIFPSVPRYVRTCHDAVAAL